ncbi:putative PLP-dependent enzyme possibly involved in cell wall biogenesis [Halobacteroides halobius DSM 5150]|uniref:Putative PLP-dependent enzyme possibly involved in cell wall biogenesis n=1 Tax=Halobacteroides halobius (strain ATCC 35273 / DSM 5150 / MD-1) TaxID=748449 RepID=L0KC50_HALHC|nr:DegT/DnrJ/EryC1/StrS family aminotransferase [Halobacteroides halobius]AGB42130.1 putative PLP-dependent enzyme possibly involved in cell wall biogenesis [Halobacteroides halobius DSM 5150]
MKHNIKGFEEPVYITRPLLPNLDQVNKKIKKIWTSKWLTNNGKQHQCLENRLQDFLKVTNLSLFNNGTIALLIACRALELSGEVITTPFSFPATTHVLEWNNITPVFCDVDEQTMNINVDKIEDLITEKTTAILPVHVFGVPCDVERIQKIADDYNLKVIYDAAHAFGVEINNQGIGEFGDASMMSFHATKMYHTLEGGSLSCSDPELKEKFDLMKNFGIKNEEQIVMPGINGKMNEIQAAIGLIVLEHLEDERNKRKLLINTYKKCLRGVKGVYFTEEIKGVKSNYQYFVIRIDEKEFGRSRDYVYEKFKEFNVFTRKYFHPLISNYSFYSQLSSAKKSKLPVANNIVKKVLSMPLYGELNVDDINKICDILKSFKR